jgi:GWxTD domain-containing protein
MTNRNNHRTLRQLPALMFALFGLAVLLSGCGPEMHSFAPDVKNTLFPPRFGFFVINYPLMNSDSSESILYARIRYDDVVFVRTDTGFSSHFQFSVNVFSDKELTDVLYSKILDRKITVPTYAMTNSITAYDTVRDKLTLKPGKYYIVLKLYDYNTDHSSSREIEHKFKDFIRSPLAISDVVLYDQSDTSGVPVDVLKGRTDTLLADFYVTTKDIPARFSLHAIAKSVESPTTIDTTMMIRQAGNVQRYKLPIETSELAPGTYQLKLSVKDGEEESSSQTTFRILRSSIPLVSAELDRELEPLIYITTPSMITTLKEGTFAERREKFLDFWLTRADNNKEAAEAMRAEFYRRVDYANQHFSGGMAHGWQSDRGRTYIVYGQPDQVESHDEDFTTPPYQIWYYYNLKLEFVFLDEFSTGDYRLIQSSQMD